MNNNVIPNFLPPAYDFTTEEDYVEEEDDVEEEEYDVEEEQETDQLTYLIALLEFAVFSLAFCMIMNSEVNVEFKFSVSKSKKQIVRSLK